MAAQLRSDIVVPTATILSVLSVSPFANSTEVLFGHAYSSFYEHREFYKSAVKALGPQWLTKEVIEAGKWLGTAPYEKNNVRDDLEMDFVVTLYGGVSATALCWWIEKDFVVTPDQLVGMVIKWAYGSMPEQGKMSRSV